LDEKDKLYGQTWRLSKNMTEEQLKQLEEEYNRENMKMWDQWKELGNGRK
jgi:hypothetical protein